jgi:HD-GYP domain-containing protein (c-di-GMP phosphodiesterase class II)
MVSEYDLLDRLEGAVPDNEGGDKNLNRLLERIVAEIRTFAEAKAAEIRRLSDIGIALSSERNLERLLERIVDEARRFTSADAGTLYRVVNNTVTGDPELVFEILQNESMETRMGGTSGKAITLPPVPMIVDGEPTHANVSAHVANTGETVDIPDVYTAEGFDFTGPRKYDQMTGYHTKSMLVAPMRNHENEIIGVLQLINAQDPVTKEVVRFSPEFEDLIRSLASQAAVAVTNAQLIADLEEMFESLIQLVATAIDEKSPYTGGHIHRVAGLTVKIAETINITTEGPYADVEFTVDEMKELRIAAWLHDIGKITTPEFVVDKATKLETIFDRVELVRMRFQYIREAMVREAAETKLAVVASANGKLDQARLDVIDETLAAKSKQLESDLEFVTAANTGGEFLKDEDAERLEAIAARSYTVDGEHFTWLTEDELNNLLIRKGTLTDDEREVINNHVVATIKMLGNIPFPNKLSNVVEYAGAHHEKLNGTGYPNGWGAERLAQQSRILCLADVCEALTARDRPYKPAMPKERAFQILGFMVKDGELDSDLLDLFLENDVYDQYMVEYEAQEAVEKEQQEAELAAK